MKHLCKFQVDTSINARVIAVQSLEISIHLYCGGHVNNAHQPILAHNKIENSPVSLAHNSANDFKSGAATYYIVSQVIPNLREIDYNLCNHILMTSYENYQAAERRKSGVKYPSLIGLKCL